MKHHQATFIRGKSSKAKRNPLFAAKGYPGSSQEH
jgi:hypothetical protein